MMAAKFAHDVACVKGRGRTGSLCAGFPDVLDMRMTLDHPPAGSLRQALPVITT